jgi:hypothetical protein
VNTGSACVLVQTADVRNGDDRARSRAPGAATQATAYKCNRVRQIPQRDVDGIKRRLDEVEQRLRARDQSKAWPVLDEHPRACLRSRLEEWHDLMVTRPAEANALLRRILSRTTCFMPHSDEAGSYYYFAGHATFAPVLEGLVPQNLASPGGRDGVYEMPATIWLAA